MDTGLLDKIIYMECPNHCGNARVPVTLRQILEQGEFICESCGFSFSGIEHPCWMDECQANEYAPFYRCVFNHEMLPASVAETAAEIILQNPDKKDCFPEECMPERLLAILAIAEPEKKLSAKQWLQIAADISKNGERFPEKFETYRTANRQALLNASPYASDVRWKKPTSGFSRILEDNVFYSLVRFYNWEEYLKIEKVQDCFLYPILSLYPEFGSQNEYDKMESYARSNAIFAVMAEDQWSAFELHLAQDSAIRIYHNFLTGCAESASADLLRMFSAKQWSGEEWCLLLSLDYRFSASCAWDKVLRAAEQGRATALLGTKADPEKILSSAAFSASNLHGLSFEDYYKLMHLLHWEKYANLDMIPRNVQHVLISKYPEILSDPAFFQKLTAEDALNIISLNPALYPKLESFFYETANRMRLFMTGDYRLISQVRPRISDILLAHSYGDLIFKRYISQFHFAVLELLVWLIGITLILCSTPVKEAKAAHPGLFVFTMICTVLLFGLNQFVNFKFYGIISKWRMFIWGILLPLPMLIFLYRTDLMLNFPGPGCIFLLVTFIIWAIQFLWFFKKSRRKLRFDLTRIAADFIVLLFFFVPVFLATLFASPYPVKKQFQDVLGESEDGNVSVTESLKKAIPFLTVEKVSKETEASPESSQETIAEEETASEETAEETADDKEAEKKDEAEEVQEALKEAKVALDHPLKRTKVEYEESYKAAQTAFDNKDYANALRNIVLCDLRKSKCQFLLGEILSSRIVKARALALKYYLKAAEKGHLKSQLRAGELLMDGGGGIETDTEGAMKWLSLAANGGLREAQFRMVLIYRTGFGCEKDPVKAYEWCVKAASQNYPIAEYWLGVFYYDGYGVKKNLAEAFKWLQKAGIHNEAGAMYLLSVMYSKGEGVEKNAELSTTWQMKALDSGSIEAKKGRRIFRP